MNIIKNQRGVTLLELTVAVAIFATTMIMATGVFKSVVEGQRSAVAAQNTQESMRYAFEIMSKDARQSLRGDDECELSAVGGNPAVNKIFNTDSSAVMGDGSSEVLYFKNKYGNCKYYFLSEEALIIASGSAPITDLGDLDTYPISPDEIKVSELVFTITDELKDDPHHIQPRVTIKMKAEMITSKEMHQQPMIMETTLSSRYYE